MIRSPLAVLAILLGATPVAAQTPAPPPATPPGTTGQARSQVPAFTLDTPIERLVANPRARAVLDRELPGLTAHDRYNQFKGMSLKALKPFSGGLLTDQRLAAVEAALAAL